MFSPKTAVTFAGVLTAAVAVGLAAPTLFAEAPRAYSILSACLTRPYLYFVINGIIISIAAVSRFHKTPEPTAETSSPQERMEEHRPKSQIAAPVIYRQTEAETVADVISQSIWPSPQQIESKEQKPMISIGNGAKAQLEELRSIIAVPAIYTSADEAAVEVRQVMSPSVFPPTIKYRTAAAEEEVEVRGVISPPIKTTLTKHRAASEAPLAHSRIGGYQRRSSKIMDGKALGVAKPKRGETLEGTWKAITDGRAMPLARHLKKSDMWADPRGKDEVAAPRLERKAETFSESTVWPLPRLHKDEVAAPRLERKVKTFSERTVQPLPRLHKEPSLGQDDLNRRVEAFINKVNEEMRLQRQESVQQYLDMINRGSHP